MNKKTTKLMATALTATMGAGIATQLVQAAEVTPYEAALEAVITMEKDPSGANIDKAYNAVKALKAGAQKDALNKRVEKVAAPHHKAVYDIMVTARTNKDLKTIGDARKAVAGMAKIFIKDAYTWSSELDNFTIEYQKTVVDTLNAIANGKEEVKQATINELREIIVGLELQRSNEGLLKLVLDYSATLDKVQMDYVNEVLAEVKAAKTTEELNVAKVKYNDLLTMKDVALKEAVQSNIGTAIVAKEAELSIPKVESVSAINANELKITFNKELIEASAEAVGSYDIILNNAAVAVNPAEVQLQSDKKTVVLKLAAPLVNGDNVKVNVDDKAILTTDYKEVVGYKGTTIVFNDTAAPKLLSASYNGSAIEFVFDEPLNVSGSVLKVDGANVVLADNYSTGEYVYTATTPLAAGNHSYVITGLEDVLGNTSSVVSGTVSVSNDTTAPSVTGLTKVSSNSFKVTFSEVVSTEGTIEVFKGAQKLVTSVAPGANGKEKIVTVSSADAVNNPLYGSNESSINLNVTVKGYKDSVLLLGSNYASNVTLTQDTTGPSMVAKNLNTTNIATQTYTVAFDEEVAAANASKITVKKDGIIQSTGIVSATPQGGDAKLVDVVFAAGTLEAGSTYVLDFGAGAVSDASTNGNSAFSVTFTVSGSSATYFVPTSVTESGDNSNSIEIDFGKEVTTSATSVSSYKLDGASLPAGTVIDYIDNKTKVLIKLPASYTVPVNAGYELTILDTVVAKDGSKVAAHAVNGGTYKESISLVDNKKPVLTSAKYNMVSGSSTESGSITLTFSENIAAIAAGDVANFVDDFVLTQAGQKLTYTVAAQGADDELVLTLGSNINVTQGVVVTVASADKLDIKDVNNNVLTAGTVLNASK